MANLEIRIRNSNMVDAIPLGEIPFRADAIASVRQTIIDWGGDIQGMEIGDETVLQFSDDGSRAFLEVVVQ